MTLTLTLSAAAVGGETVAWATSNGTATAGSDYTAASGTVSFAAGATSATITVTVLGDTTVEGNETFTVALSSPTGGLTLGTSSAVVTISNDDAAAQASLSIADVSVAEGNTGNKTVTLTVTLSAASATQVTVAYATADGTATAGSDYTAKSGTLTFAAGVTAQTITISLNPDKTKEPNETFLVNLSGAVGASIADNSATVTITDDDTARALTASDAAPSSAQSDRELTRDELDAAVAEAKVRWLAADPDADFASVTFSIEDLPGLLLGQTTGSHIVIDETAAGWGWDVAYADGRPHMDLVTAVAHELGHVLGHDHEEGELMSETLSPTVRARATTPAAPAWIRSPRAGAWVSPRPAARVVAGYGAGGIAWWSWR